MIGIMAQGWYGNRTATKIERSEIDSFISDKPANKTIIPIPDAENIVIVYNKYNEEEWLNRKKVLFEKENYELKHTVFIPEKNLKLYSRCIVCRINDEGEFESLEADDYKKFIQYLAE